MVWLKDQYQHRQDGAEQWEQLLDQMRLPPAGAPRTAQTAASDGVAAYLAAAGTSA